MYVTKDTGSKTCRYASKRVHVQTLNMKRSLNWMKMNSHENIFMIVSQEDSFSQRGKRQLGNGIFDTGTTFFPL